MRRQFTPRPVTIDSLTVTRDQVVALLRQYAGYVSSAEARAATPEGLDADDIERLEADRRFVAAREAEIAVLDARIAALRVAGEF